MPNLSIMTDGELLAWIDNFVTVAIKDPERYGTTKEQVEALKAQADDLRAKMAVRQTADDAAKSASSAQSGSREMTEPMASYLNTIIKADKSVSDPDKAAIGIDVPKPRSRTAPVRPEDLMVNGFEDNRNVLKWSRAGNKPNTQFIIECKKEGETEFSFLAATTETKYTHQNVKPGMRCTYRVKAQRAGQESNWSNEAVIY